MLGQKNVLKKRDEHCEYQSELSVKIYAENV